MTNQQLKAHCEHVIANPQDHEDWVVDMARVALSTLEAVPFAYISENIDNCYQSFGYGYTKPIYTAPPLPELKPIKLPEVCAWNLCELLAKSEVIEAIRAAGYEVKS